MRVIILADTHMPKRSTALPEQLVADLQHADLIIHAGDWQTSALADTLSQYGRLVGVHGNIDTAEVCSIFPDKLKLEAGGFTIGVVHGHGVKGTTEKRAMAAFAGEKVDCIIFGHSHIPVHKQVHGVLLFNPGSPTDKRRQPRYSYGVLTITDTLCAEHVFFDKDR